MIEHWEELNVGDIAYYALLEDKDVEEILDMLEEKFQGEFTEKEFDESVALFDDEYEGSSKYIRFHPTEITVSSIDEVRDEEGDLDKYIMEFNGVTRIHIPTKEFYTFGKAILEVADEEKEEVTGVLILACSFESIYELFRDYIILNYEICRLENKDNEKQSTHI